MMLSDVSDNLAKFSRPCNGDTMLRRVRNCRFIIIIIIIIIQPVQAITWTHFYLDSEATAQYELFITVRRIEIFLLTYCRFLSVC